MESYFTEYIINHHSLYNLMLKLPFHVLLIGPHYSLSTFFLSCARRCSKRILLLNCSSPGTEFYPLMENANQLILK